MANRQQRILQVIEQPEAQHEIKSSQLQNRRRFDVALFERNLREAPPRFRDVFCPPVESANIQPAFRKRLREKSHAAACINGIRKVQRGFQPSDGALYGFAARFDQPAILFLIERRQVKGDFRGQPDGLDLANTVDSLVGWDA
jgi:hypothetical protein